MPLPVMDYSHFPAHPAPQRRMDALRSHESIEREAELDSFLTNHTPALAVAAETELLDQINHLPKVPADLARVTLKAIAIAQYARQLEPSPADRQDTYNNIGLLLSKLATERRFLSKHHAESDNRLRLRDTIGMMSELCVYPLLAYDNTLEKPLTGRLQGAQPRYILPATAEEDRGQKNTLGESTGVDFISISATNPENTQRIQVKTKRVQTIYAPDIRLVKLSAISGLYPNGTKRLPVALENDSQGVHTRATYRHINSAARRINRILS